MTTRKTILEAIGNAVDAPFAVSFVLVVAEPAISGLVGETQVRINLQERTHFAINGSGIAPLLAPILICGGIGILSSQHSSFYCYNLAISVYAF